MTPHADDLLDRLATFIADEGAPDWSALASEHLERADSIRILAAIARLAGAHRSAQRPSADRAPADSRHGTPSRSLPFDWGPFQVREWLGRGGEGDVFRAFDPKLRREVALKLQPATRDDSIEEARHLARVRHPNVLSVHGVDVFDGQVGHWTDLLRGQTLEEKLRKEGVVPEIEATWIGIDLCRALHAVHEAGLIHGDIKASNVMREDEGAIVLLDFGAARLLRADADEPRRATPLTAAPELLRGEDASAASDLYSLAVLLYRVTSGAYPYVTEDLASLIDAQRRPRTRSLREERPELSERFCVLIERGLATRPEDRFEGAPAFASALSALIEPGDSKRQGTRAEHNLPADPSHFIGRSSEIARLRQAFERERLVVITGTGGCGKTRLALRAASSLLEGRVEEVRWVDLQWVHRPSGIAPAIASALGLLESRGQPWMETLLDRLRDRRVLLILDNCEHLVAGCADLANRLLAGAASLSILATSRERLGARGELVLPLSPLPLPRAEDTSVAELGAVDSIALFLDRARSAGTEIALDERSGPLLARICRRLDGLPLAIELAAARTRGLALPQLLSRLEDRFALLTGGSSEVPRRRTLAATLEWSHALLSKTEQAAFRRLAIFDDGWSLEAAEAVLPGTVLRRGTVLDLLSRLVAKSLVECDRGGENARYRLLESIRVFADERLASSGEAARLAERHRDHFIGLARAAGSKFRTVEEGAWARRVAVDAGNLRAAFEHALEEDFDLDRALPFAVDLSRLTHAAGRWSEARSFGRRMLARVEPGRAPSAALFDLTVQAGYTAADLSLLDEAETLFTRAHRLAIELNDRARLAVAYGYLGSLAILRGDLTESKRCQEQSLALNLELGDDRRVGICHSNLGNIAEESGDLVSARAHHAASLAASRRAGDLRSCGYTLGRLGDTNLIEQRFDEAITCYTASRAIRQELNDQWGVATCLSGLGEATLRLGRIEEAVALQEEGVAMMRVVGDRFSLVRLLMRIAAGFGEGVTTDRARRSIEEALPLAHSIGDRVDLSSLFVLLACLDLDEGRHDRAAELIGAADRILEEIQSALNPLMEAQREELRARLTELHGEEEGKRRLGAGKALGDAVAVALALGPNARAPHDSSSQGA